MRDAAEVNRDICCLIVAFEADIDPRPHPLDVGAWHLSTPHLGMLLTAGLFGETLS